MNWCRWGFHDWEYLLHMGKEKAWVEHSSSGLTVVGEGLADGVYQRCCLRCGLSEDTYTPFIREREAQEQLHKTRQEQAKALFQRQSSP